MLKRRGWSVGAGSISTRGVKGRTVGGSLRPGGGSVWPAGEAEKIAEVLWEWLRS